MTRAGVSRAVYTAVFGGYETLNEQPTAPDSAVPFICLTDDPELRSDTWDVRVVEPSFPLDPRRSARSVKIRGHDELRGFRETLWIDNTVVLRRDPGEILDAWLSGESLAVPRHSFRRTVGAEFDVVVSEGLDDEGRVREQLLHYGETHPDVLLQPALWTALLARRRSPAVGRAMTIWWDQVARYSARDQLSVREALARSGVRFAVIDIDNHESEWHSWPHGRETRGSDPPGRPATIDPSDGLGAKIARLEGLLNETTRDATASVAAREREIARLERHLASRLNIRTWWLFGLAKRILVRQ